MFLPLFREVFIEKLDAKRCSTHTLTSAASATRCADSLLAAAAQGSSEASFSTYGTEFKKQMRLQ